MVLKPWCRRGGGATSQEQQAGEKVAIFLGVITRQIRGSHCLEANALPGRLDPHTRLSSSAQAGDPVITVIKHGSGGDYWMPAFAGMTSRVWPMLGTQTSRQRAITTTPWRRRS
jgi:hypothetical protein